MNDWQQNSSTAINSRVDGASRQTVAQGTKDRVAMGSTRPQHGPPTFISRFTRCGRVAAKIQLQVSSWKSLNRSWWIGDRP